jgi:hypothetical protein
VATWDSQVQTPLKGPASKSRFCFTFLKDEIISHGDVELNADHFCGQWSMGECAVRVGSGAEGGAVKLAGFWYLCEF